jgi:hypothetical protein
LLYPTFSGFFNALFRLHAHDDDDVPHAYVHAGPHVLQAEGE